jgi:hypothetical protein
MPPPRDRGGSASRAGRGGKRTSRSRVTETRDPLPRVLIVCEGEKTEPNYFRAFRLTSVDVVVHGAGSETLRVVEEAERIDAAEGPFDAVWCVFDRDDNPAAHFNEAIRRASRPRYHAAWSNEAFELWYVLHFEYLQAAVARSRYFERLTAHLGRTYAKNDPGLYAVLQTREDTAVRNADKLLATHAEGATPSACCPATTVHHLVRYLRNAARAAGRTP